MFYKRVALRKFGLLVGASLGALSQPAVAWAQDSAPAATDQAADPSTDASEQDAIVVTGIRRSIQQSIALKRDSAGVVDAITSEDIGKLPDQNVVDTLQRVTGVQIDRSRGGNQQNAVGEGQGFTIRGISQNRVEFNGTNLIGAAASGDVSLSDFNPDILAGLTVTKTPSAQDAEGAIGGVVNLITRKPLDLPPIFASGRIEGIDYDQAGKIGYRASGMVSAKFLDNTFGILLGASRYDYKRETYVFTTDGYTRTNAIDVTGDGVADAGQTRPSRVVYDDLYARVKRTGLNGSLQWKPSNVFEMNFDAAYTKFEQQQDSTRYQILLTDAVTGAKADSSGTIYAGTYTNATPRVAVYDEPIEQTQKVFSLYGKWTPGRLSVIGRAAHSSGEQRKGINVPLLVPKAGLTNRVAVDLASGNDIPTAVLTTNYNTLDPNNYQMSTLVEGTDFINNKGDEARLDAAYDTGWSWVSALKVGARYERLQLRTDRVSRNAAASAILAAQPGIDVNHDGQIGFEEFSGIHLTGLPGGDIFPGQSGNFPRYFLGGSVDIPEIWKSLGLSSPPRDLTGVRGVDQKTLAAYAQIDLNGTIGSLPIRGNLGLRYVDSKRDSEGYVIGTATTLAEYSARFRNWLPSINLNASLTDKLVWRLAAAKVVARPPLASVSPGVSLVIINFTGTRGNPNLKPFEATQYDTSLEWYFAPASILSVSAFYKKVDSFTVNTVTTQFFDNGAYTGNYQITQPTNGSDGTIKGVEFSYQQAFRGLPKFLDGLGAGLSYTYTASSTPLINSITGKHDPLPGLSKHSYNATVFLEQGWGNVRLTYNWRDKYLDVAQAASLGGNQYMDAYGQFDASAQVNITDKVKLTLEGVNLTKNPERIYLLNEARIRDIRINDRRVYFGISASF